MEFFTFRFQHDDVAPNAAYVDWIQTEKINDRRRISLKDPIRFQRIGLLAAKGDGARLHS
jgi:hypothetical protein